MKKLFVFPTLLFLSLMTAASIAVAGNASTIAGGGPVQLEQLNNPEGVAVDAAGKVYIADTARHRIVTNDPLLGFTVIAGTTDSAGFAGDGGLATAALLNSPTDIAFDALGNLYIADSANHRIRMMTTAGVITTVAGNGIAGTQAGLLNGDGGPATAARLNTPKGVAVDAAGNIYIADTLDHRIRMITAATANISTVAGSALVPLPQQLNSPEDVAVSATGLLYVADTVNHRVVSIDLVNAIFTVVAGTGTLGFAGDGGVATAALLNAPTAITVDAAGNLYIADAANNRIRMVTSGTGLISTIAGTAVAGSALFPSGDSALATLGQLNNPKGLALDAAGNVYIADTLDRRIRKIDAVTKNIATVAGPFEQLSNPEGIAMDSTGQLYIADTIRHRIVTIDPVTGYITLVAGSTDTAGFFGDGGLATAAQLNTPTDIAFDSADNLYIADSLNHRIRMISKATGVISTVAGTGFPSVSSVLSNGDGGQATAAQLNTPKGLDIDATGNIYIADTLDHRIRKVDLLGVITTVAGDGIAGFSGDTGQAVFASLNGPRDVAIDPFGNLYISDQLNHRVRKVSGGVIVTFAGTGTAGLLGNGGDASLAQLNLPSGIDADIDGRVYIADTNNHQIRMVDTNDIIISIFGSATAVPGFSGDGGPSKLAQLSLPNDVIDVAAGLIVADTINKRIRKVAAGDTDWDDILDAADAFPLDPSASVDADGDGAPDQWNLNASLMQIGASPLALDEFPGNAAKQVTPREIPFGVNLAGAEFAPNLIPGTIGVDYTYPNAAELDYYRKKGFTYLRLPVLWERLQPTARGPLNIAELGRVDAFVALAKARKMKVIIDLHNFARYRGVVSSAAALADFWSRIATHYAAETAIYAYDLMNEPNATGVPSTWQAMAQAAVDAIRIVDTTHAIIVAGDNFSTAFDWELNNNALTVTDPANNILFEAHQYFDADSSGLYLGANGVKYQQTYQSAHGTRTFKDVFAERLYVFVGWLKKHNHRGYLGEFGVPAGTGIDPTWVNLIAPLMTYLKSERIGWTYWAGGPWWGTDAMAIEPASLVSGVDRPQMTALLPLMDSDQDGYTNDVDAFPSDFVAFLDSDGDGFTDAWNPAATAAQITASGMILDDFPTDPTRWHIPPVATNDATGTAANQAVTINVLANDFDPDGAPVSIASANASTANGGVIVQSTNGTLTYTPARTFSGVDTFLYTIQDLIGVTATATVTVTVAPDTTPPVVSAPAAITVNNSVPAGALATDAVIAAFLTAAMANDNVMVVGPVHATAVGGGALPAIFPVGQTLVQFNAIDFAGNQSAATSTVTVLDKTPPVITLTGGDMMVAQGSVFTDPGYSVTDNIDAAATITGNVVVTGGPVNTNAVVGTVFTLNYNVSDAAGNAALQISRRVTVILDNVPPVIRLNGTTPVTVVQGQPYNDAGATATDNIDGNLTASIVVANPVNTAVLGQYTVTYDVIDGAGNAAAQVVRTVNVVADQPPLITISGANPVTIELGAVYNDNGATALDDVDGNVTANLVTVSAVNSAVIGTYTVTYDVSDAAGNAAIQAVRTVNVIAVGGAANRGEAVQVPLTGSAAAVEIASAGEIISNFSSTAGTVPAGVSTPFGELSYTTSVAAAGAAQTVNLRFSSPLPTSFVMYKVDNAGVYTLIPQGIGTDQWVQLDANTVALTLTDGGRFDLDGVVDSVIVDPVAVAVPPAPVVPTPVTPAPVAPAPVAAAGGGGGCVINASTSFDPTMLLLVLLSLLFIARRGGVSKYWL